MRETAAPEALAAIAVATCVARELLRMTDEFRICSAQPSRSGRTEPTVTVRSVLYHPSRCIEPAARAEHRSKTLRVPIAEGRFARMHGRMSVRMHGCMVGGRSSVISLDFAMSIR